MRLHFDSNVYAFADERNEALAVRALLDASGHTAVGTVINLSEAWWIRTPLDRVKRVKTITTIAAVCDDRDESCTLAQELLGEIRRCRPGWLRPEPLGASERIQRAALREYRSIVSEVRRDPRYLPRGWERYGPDLSRLDERHVEALRELRRNRSGRPIGLFFPEDAGEQWEKRIEALTGTERYWRSAARWHWQDVAERRLGDMHTAWM